MDIVALVVGGIFFIAFVVLGIMITRPMDENK